MELFEPKKADADAPPAQAPGRVRRFGGGGGGNSDSQTVGTQFKQSLNRLMDNINKTNVNYIRCIKPNSEKSTTKIDEQMVVNQLRCAGVIEAICIARAGYPNRMKHEEFLEEFDLFLTDAERARISDARKLCVVIAKQFRLASPEEYQMGKTKIYLQQGVLEQLEGAKAEKLFAYVALIQSHWRRVMAHRLFLEMYAALRLIQRRAHVYVAVLHFKRVQYSVRLVQRVWRGYVGRCEYYACLCDDRARRIQRVWRGFVGRCIYHERLCDDRARKIQRMWRGYVGRCIFHHRLCEVSSIKIQCAWRRRVAQQVLWQLQFEYEQEQARLHAIELERQRQLELKLQREREEEERQRRLVEEAEAEALRLRLEQEEQERLAVEERARKEREECERREKEERERLEEERLEREREERERREREEQEARELEESAAVQLQRVARGGLARQKFAQLVLEDEVRKRKAAEEAQRLLEDDPVELEEARLENERLKKQLEELLEANIELETLTSEWKCEQDVLRATSHVQETDLKRQITQQKQKLETARGEYTTLCAYIDQNGGELPRPANDGDHPEENDTDSDNDSISSGEGHDRPGSRPIKSPFMDDRTSSNVSSLLQRPTMSSRMQARKEVLRAGAKQLGRARQWVTNSANSREARKAADQNEPRSSSSATAVDPTASTNSASTGSRTRTRSSARLPKFRWNKSSS